MKLDGDSPLSENINTINSCFRAKVVMSVENKYSIEFHELFYLRYYSAGYTDKLLERVENHGNKTWKILFYLVFFFNSFLDHQRRLTKILSLKQIN